MEFLLAVVLIATMLVTLYAVCWVVLGYIARRRAHALSRDQIERLVGRECANLDQEYKDLLRR
jgi:hypothetical protein